MSRARELKAAQGTHIGADGTELRISDMTDVHIANALRYCLPMESPELTRALITELLNRRASGKQVMMSAEYYKGTGAPPPPVMEPERSLTWFRTGRVWHPDLDLALSSIQISPVISGFLYPGDFIIECPSPMGPYTLALANNSDWVPDTNGLLRLEEKLYDFASREMGWQPPREEEEEEDLLVCTCPCHDHKRLLMQSKGVPFTS